MWFFPLDALGKVTKREKGSFTSRSHHDTRFGNDISVQFCIPDPSSTFQVASAFSSVISYVDIKQYL